MLGWAKPLLAALPFLQVLQLYCIPPIGLGEFLLLCPTLRRFGLSYDRYLSYELFKFPYAVDFLAVVTPQRPLIVQLPAIGMNEENVREDNEERQAVVHLGRELVDRLAQPW